VVSLNIDKKGDKFLIPARVVFEYPQRCLQLIEAIEKVAMDRNLVGSFSLLIAPSLFVIPYARTKGAWLEYFSESKQ